MEKHRTQKKSRKPLSKATKKRLAIITPIAIIILLVTAYFGSYYAAIRFSNVNDYRKADKLILSPKITAIHDAKFAAYINTCKILISGDTSTAESQFLEYGDYLQAAQMVYECQYVRGLQQFDNRDYYNAARIFQPLFVKTEASYKDVRELFVKSVEQYASVCIDNGDYASAITFLSANKTFAKEIENDIKEITPVIYDGAVALYRAKEYDKASKCFGELRGYKDADKYNRIVKYHTVYANFWVGDGSDYAYFIKDLDFEDTKQVILSKENLALQFLRGKWSSSDGRKSIEFKKDTNGYWSYYTLPYFSLSNSHYEIRDGIYKISNDKESKDMYRFTIIDSHTINVYCYKDGSTYRLYKQ